MRIVRPINISKTVKTYLIYPITKLFYFLFEITYKRGEVPTAIISNIYLIRNVRSCEQKLILTLHPELYHFIHFPFTVFQPFLIWNHIKLDTLFQIAFSEASYKKLYIMHVSLQLAVENPLLRIL